MERLSHRWTCRDCGAVFSYESLPPREGCKKEVCTGELFQRSDDNPETQAHRIECMRSRRRRWWITIAKPACLREINGEHTIEYVHQSVETVGAGWASMLS